MGGLTTDVLFQLHLKFPIVDLLLSVFLFSLLARETYDSFTEEQFCEHMRRATLPGEEFLKHREAVEGLLNN